jgi:hypothetical protein
MGRFYFDLIYNYLKSDNKQALAALEARFPSFNRPAVIDGVYYPYPLFKVKKEQENPLQALLSPKQYDLFQHIKENKSINLKCCTGINNSDKDEEIADLVAIVETLTIGKFYPELYTFCNNLKLQLTKSLRSRYSTQPPEPCFPPRPYAEQTFKYYSVEALAWSKCFTAIIHGYAVQGNNDGLKNFIKSNEDPLFLDSSSSELLRQKELLKAFAVGGYFEQTRTRIYSYPSGYFKRATIARLAFGGHYEKLEAFCLATNIDVCKLLQGFLEITEFLTDEDVLRMLVEGKNTKYKAMLCEALRDENLHILNTQLKLGDTNNSKFLTKPQKETLWVYAHAIRQIMSLQHCSYEEAVQQYLFVDPISNKVTKSLSNEVNRYAQALQGLCSPNNFLDEENGFAKAIILIKLALKETEEYIKKIQETETFNERETKKLESLSDFKLKAEIYFANKTEENKRNLSQAAQAAAAYFPPPEQQKRDGKIALGILLGLIGVLLLPTVVPTVFLWRSAYSLFKEVEGTKSNLQEIAEGHCLQVASKSSNLLLSSGTDHQLSDEVKEMLSF